MKGETSLNDRGQSSQALILALAIAAGLLFAVLALPAATGSSATAASEPAIETNPVGIWATGSYTTYFPLVFRDPPTPQVVANVSLPGAKCPNTVAANPVSGYAYVANSFSDNVNVLSGTTVLATVGTGIEPTTIASDPYSERTYVTNLLGHTLSAFERTSLVDTIPTYIEPFAVTVNPVNGYLYVTHLPGVVRIIQNATTATDIEIGGWLLATAANPHTGLTYVANWEYGYVMAINGTQVVATLDVGWGPRVIVIDPTTEYVYVASSEAAKAPSGHSKSNLTVISGTQVIAAFTTSSGSSDVAVDPVSGYVYGVNPQSNSVTVLRGTTLVDTLAVGRQPRAVAVNPNTGYAFVANQGSDTITVLRHGAIVTTLPTGREPFAVGVDTRNNYVYVANRASEEVCDKNDICHWECRSTTVTILR